MIRRDFLRKAGTAAIAGMLTLSPMTGAIAAEQKVAVPASVPVKDVRGASSQYLPVLAAEVSKDAVVIIFYGNNRELYNLVKAGAEDAIAEGYPVRGILVADGKDAVEVYAHTQSFSYHDDPDDGIRFQTKVEVMKAYRDVIEPSRKQAALQSNGPSAAVTN